MTNQWPTWVRTGGGAVVLILLLAILYTASDAVRDRFAPYDRPLGGVEKVWWLGAITADTVDMTPGLMYSGWRGEIESRKHGECLGPETGCMPNGYYLEQMEPVTYSRRSLNGTQMLVLRNPTTGFVDNIVDVEPEWEAMSFDAFVEMRTRCLEEEARALKGTVFTGGDYVWYPEYQYCGGDFFNPTLEGGNIVSLKYRYLP